MLDTRERYRRFATTEARGRSAIYESWALAAADDDDIVDALERIPDTHRQPYLVFAVSRLLGAPVGAYGPWREWVLGNADELVRECSVRTTQTNEPRRCASLLPALAGVPQPIALIEIGAAAGLCLYPDRYSYHYRDAVDQTRAVHPASGASTVLLECETHGDVPVPHTLPTIVERVAIDLRPLDVRDIDDRTWLEALVWPGETDRLELIRAACNIIRTEPPRLVTADVTTERGRQAVRNAIGTVPAGVTPVVVTAGVLVYVPFHARAAVIRMLLDTEARWLALEGVDVIPEVREALGGRARPGGFVVSVDAIPLAWTSPHGHDLEWIADAPLP